VSASLGKDKSTVHDWGNLPGEYRPPHGPGRFTSPPKKTYNPPHSKNPAYTFTGFPDLL